MAVEHQIYFMLYLWKLNKEMVVATHLETTHLLEVFMGYGSFLIASDYINKYLFREGD